MAAQSVPDRQGLIYGPVIAVVVFSIVLVPLRIWARLLAKVGMWWDDWVLLVAWGGAILSSSFAFATTYYGAGKHLEDIRGPQTSMLYYLYLVEIISHVTIGITKISFILLYARVFATRKFHVILWVLGALVAVWQLVTWPILIAQCTPVRLVWDHSVPGTCINLTHFLFAQSIPDAIFDLVLLCLPMVFVMRLQMRFAQKAALFAVFGLGVFDMTCSVARLVVFLQLPTLYSKDISWYFVAPITWSIVEVNVGIICACLVTLKPLLVVLMPKRYSQDDSERPFSTTTETFTSKSNIRSSRPRYGAHQNSWFERLQDSPTRDVETATHNSLEQLTVGTNGGATTRASALMKPSGRTRDIEMNEIGVHREIEVSHSQKKA